MWFFKIRVFVSVHFYFSEADLYIFYSEFECKSISLFLMTSLLLSEASICTDFRIKALTVNSFVPLFF